jgi:DNA adenine methylase
MPVPRKYTSNAERQKAYRERKRNTQSLQTNDAPEKVKNPALRYHGGKWRIGSWVIEHFPVHGCYVEPFGGGASVLLQKEPATREVYNDLSSLVVNFFRVLRECPEQLIRAIEFTPYSRLEHQLAWQPSPDPVESARRFYIRAWQSFGSATTKTSGDTGWRTQKSVSRASAIKSFNNIENLWAVAARFKLVQIECDEASKIITRFDTPDTLFYLDPPYLFSTRSDKAGRAYHAEMSDEDHIALAEQAKAVQGLVIISGYPSPLYDELYTGWLRVEKETQDVTAGKQIEAIWLSPKVQERLQPTKPTQKSLFSEVV